MLADLAARHAATPFEVALAWLTDLSDFVVPLPGPTRVETALSIARARNIVLTHEDRSRLNERVPAGRRLRLRRESQGDQRDQGEKKVHNLNRLSDLPVLDDREVVLIMGLPGAGKSTVARSFVAQGYERLNRDEAGGTLSALLPALDRLISSGSLRLVLDNTYVSRASRAAVIQTASKRGLPVRCVRLSTSLEDAQVNAVGRMVSQYGRLLTPEEIRKATKRDVGAFGPTAQFRYQRELEPPDPSEGFSRIEVMAFERRRDPSFSDRALILWCDGVLRRSRSGRRAPLPADDVEVFVERREVLARYRAEGWRLLGLSWQPEIAEESVSAVQVDAGFTRMQELLGLEIEIEYCPHGGGPPICWCRKPLPGLGVVFIQRHRLDAPRCIYVGAGAQDPGFARRLGFQYRDAASFFGDA